MLTRTCFNPHLAVRYVLFVELHSAQTTLSVIACNETIISTVDELATKAPDPPIYLLNTADIYSHSQFSVGIAVESDVLTFHQGVHQLEFSGPIGDLLR